MLMTMSHLFTPIVKDKFAKCYKVKYNEVGRYCKDPGGNVNLRIPFCFQKKWAHSQIFSVLLICDQVMLDLRGSN